VLHKALTNETVT